MSWTRENIERFIEIYRNHPCLWKIKSDEYKNKNLKNAAYQKLVNFCKEAICVDANKDFVIKKIQGIRGAFRKEVKKIKETKRSGASEEAVHKPNLWYFDLLLFTLDQEVPTESLSNLNEENVQSLDEVETKSSSEISDGDDASGEIGKKAMKQKEAETEKGLKRTYASLIKANLEFMQECQRVLQKSNVEISEYEAVGINVTKKLEKMDNTQAIYAEALISVILRKGLLSQLTPNTDICDGA